jgi:hypothetical protein
MFIYSCARPSICEAKRAKDCCEVSWSGLIEIGSRPRYDTPVYARLRIDRNLELTVLRTGESSKGGRDQDGPALIVSRMRSRFRVRSDLASNTWLRAGLSISG